MKESTVGLGPMYQVKAFPSRFVRKNLQRMVLSTSGDNAISWRKMQRMVDGVSCSQIKQKLWSGEIIWHGGMGSLLW